MMTRRKTFRIPPGFIVTLVLLHSVPSFTQSIKPRQPDSQITDKGYGQRAHGWYDAQCQGASNDYCRYVGDAPDVFWSCALAGSTDQYTPAGQYQQESTYAAPCRSGSYINVDPAACTTAVAKPGIDWTNEIASTLSTAVSFIPEVGGILSAVMNIFWPIVDSNLPGDVGSTRDISDCAWKSITSYVQQYVTKALDQQKIQNLQNTLSGTQELMKEYMKDIDSLGFKKGSPVKFNNLYSSFVLNDPAFNNAYTSTSPGDVLPVLLPWVSMHVGVMQEMYCNDTMYYNNYTNPTERACHLQNLNQTLTEHIQRLTELSSNITSYEANRYYLYDQNWPNQHKNNFGVIVDAGRCDNLPDEVCGGLGQYEDSGCAVGCANTDWCTCYNGYVYVYDRYLGTFAGGDGLYGQAVWKWWGVWFWGGIEGGAQWRTSGGQVYKDGQAVPQHADALQTGNSNLAAIQSAHNQHVASGMAQSVGKMVQSLQALQVQIATDPTQMCGPDSSVVTDPQPGGQCTTAAFNKYVKEFVAVHRQPPK